jgi:hypothetical protein
MLMRSLLLSAAVLFSGALWPALAPAQNCGLRDANLQGSYDGACIRGWANGQGRAAGKDRYEGSFLDGHAHGEGSYTFADGTRFEGQFAFGRVTGRARFHYPSGDVLEGEFRDNRLVGVGQLHKAGKAPLLVEWRGAHLVPVQAPVQADAAATVPGNGMVVPGMQPGDTAAPLRGDWSPTVDLEDLFPSFILATATRKQAASADARSGGPRGDVLSRSVVPPPDQMPAARMANIHGAVTYLGDTWGLLGVRVRTQQAGVKATVRINADEVAEPTEETFSLGQAGDYVLYPRLRYRWDRLRNVSQPAPMSVTWSLSLDGQPAGSQTRVVRLRSTQDAPWVVEGARGAEFMGWVFTAFVTEDAPWIDELLGQAFKDAPVSASGYQTDEKGVITQVAVVYEYLRSRGFKYSNITTVSGSGTSRKVASQTVRFPSDSMRTSQANCIDGTVLFASILRKIGIDAYIVTGPGHAMLGFATKNKVPKKEFLNHFVVVETTALGSAGFDVAVKSGRKTFLGWLDKARNDLMFDVISVADARRAGVMPIAR